MNQYSKSQQTAEHNNMMFDLKNPELKHLLICWSKVLIIFQLLRHQTEDENFICSLLLFNDQKAVDHNIHLIPPTVENNVNINWNHQLIISKLIRWHWLMNIDHILSTALLLLLKYLYTVVCEVKVKTAVFVFRVRKEKQTLKVSSN